MLLSAVPPKGLIKRPRNTEITNAKRYQGDSLFHRDSMALVKTGRPRHFLHILKTTRVDDSRECDESVSDDSQ